jgi:hypothetical protein
LRPIFFLTLALALVSVGKQAESADAPDFDRTVAPILARRCFDCHSGSDPKGGLDLSRRATAMRGGDGGEAIVPGKPDESLFWENVADGSMPPKSKLTDAEKSTLRAWIAAGARWGTDPVDPYLTSTDRRAGRDWWSFQPIARPAIKIKPGENPIDGLVRRGLETAGLKPSPPADRRVLIRRLSFDLLGLPPTPDDIEAFLKDDRPDAYERLVDRYLASPQYGVRWARPWLDLARFGESGGFEYDEFRPNAWRYRDWVVDALNRDMPYDEFVRRQVAGDILHPDDPGSVEATGFLVAGAYDTVGQNQLSVVMKKIVRQDDLEDMVSTVGQAFLGLTVHCARCHDHKFDPIRQVEYYRMTAALAGVRHGERDLTSLDPDVRDAKRRITDLSAKIAAIEAPARATVRGSRSPKDDPPTPIGVWDFAAGGASGITLQGSARIDSQGLKVDGKTGFAATIPLARDLRAKTIEAWVRLDSLDQRGGGVISVQIPDGSAFDAIVFGENEPGRWMAGSEGFARTQSFAGPPETDALLRPVHVAIVYSEDGTISGYREGRPYGKSYRSARPVVFPAGKAQLVFGLRHGSPGGNRMLAGTIARARLYDRALTAAEVERSAASGPLMTAKAIEEALSPAARTEISALRKKIDVQNVRIASRGRNVYAVAPRTPEPVHLLTRGNPAQPAELLSAGGLAVIGPKSAEFGLTPDAPEGERRVKLARWLTAPENPLFPRVIVNRLWLWHFGTGLVEQPSDFGFNGGKPSHPELLDSLAGELIRRGWSLKQLHKLILTSATYRQSSRMNPDAAKVDAGDRLLWRKAPQRLEAEMVRDAMLASSGLIDLRLGGPGYREFEVSKAEGTPAILYRPLGVDGPEFTRRTLYRTWARGGRSGFLDAFDCPDPSTTSPRRAVTTTPQQALALLNNALTFRLADRFAARLREEVGTDPARQADRAYLLAFGRPPDATEREEARRVIAEYGAAVFARAIFNSNEFLYID